MDNTVVLEGEIMVRVAGAGSVVRQEQAAVQSMQQQGAVKLAEELSHLLRVPTNLRLPLPPDFSATLQNPASLSQYLQANCGEKYNSYFTEQLQKYQKLSAILADPNHSEAITLSRHLCKVLKGEIDNTWKKIQNPHEKVVAYALLATNLATLPTLAKEQCQAALTYSRNLHNLEELAERVSSYMGRNTNLADFLTQPGLQSAVHSLMSHVVKATRNLSFESIEVKYQVSTFDIVRDSVARFYNSGMSSSEKIGKALVFSLIATYVQTGDQFRQQIIKLEGTKFANSLDAYVNTHFLAPESADQLSHINSIYLLNPKNKEQADLLLRVLYRYSQKRNPNFKIEPSQEVKNQVQQAVMRVFVNAVGIDQEVANASRLKNVPYNVPSLRETVWQQFLHRGRFYAKSGDLADKLLYQVTPQQDIDAVRNGSYLATAKKLADLQGLTGSKRLMEIGKLLLSTWMILSVKNRLAQ